MDTYVNYAVDWIDSKAKRQKLIDGLLEFNGKLIDSYRFKSYKKPTHQVLLSLPEGKKEQFEQYTQLTLKIQKVTGWIYGRENLCPPADKSLES